MTKEQYDKIVSNQEILERKLNGIINEIRTIKEDLSTAINNQRLLEQYEIEITDKLKKIERNL